MAETVSKVQSARSEIWVEAKQLLIDAHKTGRELMRQRTSNKSLELTVMHKVLFQKRQRAATQLKRWTA